MYLLDSNVFIDAARLYYHPDIAPPFWRWLLDRHENGELASIRHVKDELIGTSQGHRKDFLSQWANEIPSSFWLEPDDEAMHSFARLTDWVENGTHSYSSAAKSTFFRAADYYLVAQAHGGNHTVVSSEASSPASRKRILIPDACRALQTRCVKPFSVYRELRLSFA